MAAATECLKMVLCGNGSVGKTSIIQRFVADGFSKVYRQTVGLDFFEKSVKLHGGKPATLQVWDIGGQSIGSKMLDKYLGGANAIFLCYDVTDSKSFADIEDWLAKVLAAAGQVEGRPSLFLVGNKADLIHLRQVTQETHDSFVDTNRLDGGFLVSASNGDRVTRSFYEAAGKASGNALSDHDLSFHDSVVGVTTAAAARIGSASDKDATTTAAQQAELDRIAAEDEASEKRLNEALERELARDGDAGGGCCAVM
jgi:Ras-related protein Rab-28